MRISDWSSDVCSSDLRQRIVQVELAALDVPGGRVGRGGVALRDRPGAIAAVLRRVECRIGGEGVTVGGGGEAPHRSLVAVGELGLALHRFAVGEVGDGIVAVDGEAVLAEHRVDGEGGAGGEKAGAEKARAEDANGKTADRKSTRLNSSTQCASRMP